MIMGGWFLALDTRPGEDGLPNSDRSQEPVEQGTGGPRRAQDEGRCRAPAVPGRAGMGYK